MEVPTPPLTPPTPTLTGMPLELLQNILDYTEWRSLFAVRKTCRTLRNVLISYKPVVRARWIRFKVTKNGFYFCIGTWNERKPLKLHNVSPEQLFNDVKIILDHVKLRLNSFTVKLLSNDEIRNTRMLRSGTRNVEIRNTQLLQFLENYFKSREHKLETIDFMTNALNRMAPVLSNLHENSPRVFRFTRVNSIVVVGEDVTETIQWKNARFGIMNGVWIQDSVFNFSHFPLLHAWFLTVTADEVIEIIELFISDHSKKEFLIRHKTLLGFRQFTRRFGDGRQEGRVLEWFFRRAQNDKCVKCERGNKTIFIKHCDITEIPPGVLIGNL